MILNPYPMIGASSGNGNSVAMNMISLHHAYCIGMCLHSGYCVDILVDQPTHEIKHI